ncbi:MAG: hypothetical protein FWE61_01920, partial [Micrococcales bacterium]|nr:hypothetical protein [Micrococcales bacterium]
TTPGDSVFTLTSRTADTPTSATYHIHVEPAPPRTASLTPTADPTRTWLWAGAGLTILTGTFILFARQRV